MDKIEIFNRTDKYLVVNSVEIGGNKLTIPPVSSGRGSGAIDAEFAEDLGILELIERKEITVRKLREPKVAKKTAAKTTKKPTTSKTAKKKATTKKPVAKKKTAAKKTGGKNPHKAVVEKDTGKPVIMTARGSAKRVGTVHSAETAFVDDAKSDENDEYSTAFIEV